MEIINLGINKLQGTAGLHLRTEALDELTNSPRFLALQNNQLRERLKDMSFVFEVMMKDARSSEMLPIQHDFLQNPIISIGEAIHFTGSYYDIDYSKTIRNITENSRNVHGNR